MFSSFRNFRPPAVPEIMLNMDPCAMNLEGNQRATSIQISELESMAPQDPTQGRQRETNLGRETKGDKPGKHDETGSSRRVTKGDKPGNHDETRSNRRETKGDKPGNHDETKCSRRETKGDKEK